MESIDYSRIWAVGGVCIALSGCGTMDQASLGYVSTRTIGIGANISPSEPTAVSLVIGYKDVDMAYVPVAVAKTCDSKASNGAMTKNCEHEIYKLALIAGNNSDGDKKVVPEALKAARLKLQDFQQALSTRDGAKTAYDNSYAAFRQADDEYNEKASKLKALADTSPDRGSMEGVVAIALAKRNQTELTLKTTKNASDSASDSFDKLYKGQKLEDLLQAVSLVSSSENVKTDAYSVYGSFDAQTSGTGSLSASATGEGSQSSKPEASGATSLKLGKTFSTGVASQNLTEGVRELYKLIGSADVEKARRNCFESAKEFLNKYEALLGNPGSDNEKKTKNEKMKMMMESIGKNCIPPGG